MATEVGFVVKDASFSPITGGEGNIEFLFHLVNPVGNEEIPAYTAFNALVEEAHSALK